MARRVLKKSKNISKHIKTGGKKIKKTADQKIIESIERSGVTFSVEGKLSKVVPIVQPKKKRNAEQIEVEEIDISSFNQMVKTGNKNKEKKISIDERTIMEGLIKKHGTNFLKMKMDHKVNKFQWNETQIKKVHELYMKEYNV